MKKLTIKQLISYLEGCVAVIVDAVWLCYPSFDYNDEIFDLDLCHSDGYNFKFDSNCGPQIHSDGRILLVDIYGEEFSLTLLTTMPLE